MKYSCGAQMYRTHMHALWQQHFKRNDRLLFQESSVFTQNPYPKRTNFFFNEMDQLSFGCWCSVCFVLMCARTVNKTAYSIQYLPPVHWHILMFIHSCLFIYSLFWRWWWWIRTFEMTSHNINLNKCAAHTFSMENLSLLIHRRPYIVQWRAAAISNFSLAA